MYYNNVCYTLNKQGKPDKWNIVIYYDYNLTWPVCVMFSI